MEFLHLHLTKIISINGSILRVLLCLFNRLFMFCFVYFALFIKVCLYVVLLLFEEIQTSGFEFYDLKPNASNEHYIKE